MKIFLVLMLLTVPVLAREPTLWILRIEGEKQEYLLPIEVMQEWGLHAGQTVSQETARRIAIDMGAEYPTEILRRLEEMK